MVMRTAVAAVTPAGESLPAFPDLSLGKRNQQLGAARIGVFAYDRQTREPVWQAGVLTGNAAARDAAASLGREKLPFKRDVRKLKELGLTKSLLVGYRLSPRGRAYLRGATGTGSRRRMGSPRSRGRSG